MENKYYTPELSEFCVGFEYERNEPHRIYYKENSPTEYKWVFHRWDETQIKLGKLVCEINVGNIRVKYLDQQDIEDCGFIPDIPVNVSPSEYIPTSWGYNGYGLCAEYPYNESKYQIRNEDDDCLFDGAIKNKTEFKKLLKMLGI